MTPDPTMIIKGAIAIIIGLVILPVVALFIGESKANTDVTNISGLENVLDLIGYGFGFGLVGLGIGMVVWGFKN